MQASKRVLLVDDHPTFRAVLAEVVESQSGLAVVGEAHDGIHAIELLNERPADVIVMDLSMPRLDGIEATRAIRQSRPEIPVIGLAIRSADDSEFRRMLDAGAERIVSKLDGGEAIVAEIFRVIPGSRFAQDQARLGPARAGSGVMPQSEPVGPERRSSGES